MGGQTTSLVNAETRYPHVSVPFRSKRGSAAAELAYLYERKDVFKPLPLEGYYVNLPVSSPTQAPTTNNVDFLYDEPTSLSLFPFRTRGSGKSVPTWKEGRSGEQETGLETLL